MANVDGVAPTGGTSSTDPGSTTADADLQKAFADGIVKFMGVMLQSAQSDITAAIQDNTSDPDAPG